MKELILTVNGPGELMGIALPLVRAFKREHTGLICTLFTVPCQFSSGLEASTAKALGVFDHIFTVEQYKSVMLRGKFPAGYQPQEKGLVFYAGGDSFHALLLAKKCNYPVCAYDEGNVSQKDKFTRLFSREEGDLMVDAAYERKLGYQAVPITDPRVTIGLYPGSRPKHIALMIPFLTHVAQSLRAKYPHMQFRWGVPEGLRNDCNVQAYFDAPFEEPGTTYDLIICLSGTNTGISATLGIPLIALLPFNDPKLIPFMGLFGLIAEVPVLGPWLKKMALGLVRRSITFVAIPNIKAKRLVVPEMIGVLLEQDVMREAERLLLDIPAREIMHKELPVVMGSPAAAVIVSACKEYLG